MSNRDSVQIRPLLTETETASVLGCQPAALRQARCTGTGAFAALQWVKMGATRRAPIRYRPEDIEFFISASQRRHVEPALPAPESAPLPEEQPEPEPRPRRRGRRKKHNGTPDHAASR